MSMVYADRRDAGRRLATRLAGFAGRDVVVAGLPRGGVPVAFEVARALGAPLDVIVVRKVGVPFQPELAMGAIGEDGTEVVDAVTVRSARVNPEQLAAAERRALAELTRRAAVLRADRPPLLLTGRTVVIVDDGLATGSTARAACRVARARGAGRVVLAVPVAAPDAVRRLLGDADEVVVDQAPEGFHSVGQFYEDFTPTSDELVAALLARHTG
jgi:putative phosphoribosyl transferase